MYYHIINDFFLFALRFQPIILILICMASMKRKGKERERPSFAIQCGHAAAARGRDGLTVPFVLQIATRENTLDVGVRRSRLHLDVPVGIDLDRVLCVFGVAGFVEQKL